MMSLLYLQMIRVSVVQFFLSVYFLPPFPLLHLGHTEQSNYVTLIFTDDKSLTYTGSPPASMLYARVTSFDLTCTTGLNKELIDLRSLTRSVYLGLPTCGKENFQKLAQHNPTSHCIKKHEDIITQYEKM